jgi:hypothetical protein
VKEARMTLPPEEVDRIDAQLEIWRTVGVIGLLGLVVAGPMAMFASTEPLNGGAFMIVLMNAYGGMGTVLALAGWIRVRQLEGELRRSEPYEAPHLNTGIATHARGAAAGH